MSQGDNYGEIITWRLIGSIVWYFLILLPSYLAWAILTGSLTSLVHLQAWFCLVLFLVLQLPPLLAHRIVMILHPPTPANSLIVTLINNGAREVIAGALLMGVHAACGALAAPLLGLTSPGPSVGDFYENMFFGVVVGLCRSFRPLLAGEGGGSSLMFPSIHRPRFFTLKQRLPIVFRGAANDALGASLIYLALALAPPVGNLAILPVWTRCFQIDALWWRLVTAGLLSICGSAAFHVLEVVHTERHQFISLVPDASSEQHCTALLAALKAKDQPLIQRLAYQDMNDMACEHNQLAWRRQAVFQFASGHIWIELAKLCSQPLNELLTTLAPVVTPLRAVPRGSVLDQEGRAPPPTLPLNAVAQATWYLRHNFEMCAWAISGLGGLLAAARQEDAFGALQLKEPSLGGLTALLLDCLVCTRMCVAAGVDPALPPPPALLWVSARVLPTLPRLASPFSASNSFAPLPNLLSPLHRPTTVLVDMLENTLYRVVGTYGIELVRAIEGRKSDFGESKIRVSLLESMLDYTG